MLNSPQPTFQYCLSYNLSTVTNTGLAGLANPNVAAGIGTLTCNRQIDVDMTLEKVLNYFNTIMPLLANKLVW